MTTSTRPVPGIARPYHFPGLERSTLANGVRVIVAPMPRLPLVTALVLIDAGSTLDPIGDEGLAALAARALTEGTGSIDGAALTERLESLGTSLDGYADWDSTVARLTVMPDRLDAAFELLARVVREPSFPEADVIRKRDERLADLKQILAEPRSLADQRFSGYLHAPSSRYARSSGGTLTTVAGLDTAKVRAFHGARYAPTVTTVILVGDITAARAHALVEAAFGDWRATATGAGPRAGEEAGRARRVIIVDKPEAPQSELRVGHTGVPRSHPDHLRIVVMNAILGGLFSSRINLNLRERHAFTYGASSGFDWRRGAGPFVVSTAVKSEVSDRAVAEILGEIERMRAAPPEGSEVTLATDYLAGVFPLRYESTDAVAGAIANSVIHGLPEDWFSAYRDRVRAIGADDVRAAARAHLDPSRLLVLAVGDAQAIRAPLEALDIGDVKVVAAGDDPAEAR